MEFLDNILKKFGSQSAIKLKMYRKEIIELENRMNAIKTLPIQYRLGRVKGIGKNMPEVLEKYELYESEFNKLNVFQNNDIMPLINEIDEQLFYRKLTGARKKIVKLKMFNESQLLKSKKNIELQVIILRLLDLRSRILFQRFPLFSMILIVVLLLWKI